MPAVSAKQYGLMQAAAHGNMSKGMGPSPEVARDFIAATPAKKRSAFSKALHKKKKERTNNG